MKLQEVIIIIIGVIAFGIFLIKIYRWITTPSDPCSECSGCELQQETKRNKKGFKKYGFQKKIKTLKIWGCITALSTTFLGCEKITEPSAVNQWIYNEMEREYLYSDDIPVKKSIDFSTTHENFFNKLLSVREIRNSGSYLSTIEENRSSTTRAFDDASDWYGFDVQIWEIKNKDIVATVLYCQKNSPAYRSGIRRGDIIYNIDNVKLTTNSYSALRSGGSKKIGRYIILNNTLYPRDIIKLEASESLHKVPIHLDSLIITGNKKVGYLVYNSFATGPAGFVDKSYEVNLLNSMSRFKNQNVDDFILDLRYNGGGYIEESAILASCIVKSEQLGKLFAYTLTNKKINQQSNKNFATTSVVGNSNLNLSRLFVLTSRRTASASELLINGLTPFCQVIQIGSKTEGKNIGSYALKDSRYNWTIYPITLNIYNSRGENDYAKGYIPSDDNFIEETISLFPFGDNRDPLLAKALGIINPQTLQLKDNRSELKVFFVPLHLDNSTHQRSLMIEGDRQ